MEDEGNHGNDDTRCFILSTLAGQHKSKVTCALCEDTMYVFDRYPLVDGTFFLSPGQHTKDAVEVSKLNLILHVAFCFTYLSSLFFFVSEGYHMSHLMLLHY